MNVLRALNIIDVCSSVFVFFFLLFYFLKTSCPKCNVAKKTQSTQTTKCDETVNRSSSSNTDCVRPSNDHQDIEWTPLDISNSTFNGITFTHHRRSHSTDGAAVRSMSLDISNSLMSPPMPPARYRHRRSRSAGTAVSFNSLDESSILYRLRSHDKHQVSNSSQRDDDLSIVWLWHRVPGGTINSFNLLNNCLKSLILDRKMKPVRLYNIGKWRQLLKKGRYMRIIIYSLTFVIIFLICKTEIDILDLEHSSVYRRSVYHLHQAGKSYICVFFNHTKYHICDVNYDAYLMI